MPSVKNNFLKGRMNKDLDDRLVPQGEYRDAKNIRISKSDTENAGVVQNIKGTTSKLNLGLADDYEVIGYYFSEARNEIIFFSTNNTNHRIDLYDIDADTDYILTSGSYLNFHKDNLITGINVIDDLLFFTDNRNQPRKLNIETAKSKGSAYYNEDKISVAKYAPYQAPKFTMSYDSEITGDYIEEKFVRFSYRYKYKDNEYSVLAPFTQIAFQMGDGTQNTTDGNKLTADEITKAYKSTILEKMVNGANKVALKIPLPTGDTGPTTDYEIIEVDVLIKDSNSPAVRILETIEITDSSLDANNEISYTYKSSLPTKTLPADQITRVSDKVPVRALAQEVAGNRIIYGNITENVTFDQNEIAETGSLPKINYTVGFEAKNAVQEVDNLASTKFDHLPHHSLKQRRTYQVGIVLSDKYGRQSPVILSENSTIYVPAKDDDFDSTGDWVGDCLTITFEPFQSGTDNIVDPNHVYNETTNPYGWYSYRFVVKQLEQEYYNVYTPGAQKFEDIAYLTLHGDNINKVPQSTTATATDTRLGASDTRLFPKVVNTSTFTFKGFDLGADNSILFRGYNYLNLGSPPVTVSNYTPKIHYFGTGSGGNSWISACPNVVAASTSTIYVKTDSVISGQNKSEIPVNPATGNALTDPTAGGNTSSDVPTKAFLFLDGELVDGLVTILEQDNAPVGGGGAGFTFNIKLTLPQGVSLSGGTKWDLFLSYDFKIDPNTTGNDSSADFLSMTQPTYNGYLTTSPSDLEDEKVGLTGESADPAAESFDINEIFQKQSDGSLINVTGMGTLDLFEDLRGEKIKSGPGAGFYQKDSKHVIASLSRTNAEDGIIFPTLNTFTGNELGGKAVDLAVFETEPRESALDLFFESATSDTADGLISDLNEAAGEEFACADALLTGFAVAQDGTITAPTVSVGTIDSITYIDATGTPAAYPSSVSVDTVRTARVFITPPASGYSNSGGDDITCTINATQPLTPPPPDPEDPVPPLDVTAAATNITNTGFTATGTIPEDGGGTIATKGFWFGSNGTTYNGTGNYQYSISPSASFTRNFTDADNGFADGTTRYLWAYATTTSPTDDDQAKANVVIPADPTAPNSVSTNPNPTEKSTNTMTVRGTYTLAASDTSIQEVGFYFGTDSNYLNNTRKIIPSTTSSPFTYQFTSLTPTTTYYFRAFAKNSIGETVGTTTYVATTNTSISLPTAETQTESNVTDTSFTANGGITSSGGGAITDKGFYIKQGSSAFTANDKVSRGTGTLDFELNKTGLNQNETWYYQAYAVNSAGEDTGSIEEVTTTGNYGTRYLKFVLNATLASGTQVQGNTTVTLSYDYDDIGNSIGSSAYHQLGLSNGDPYSASSVNVNSISNNNFTYAKTQNGDFVKISYSGNYPNIGPGSTETVTVNVTTSNILQYTSTVQFTGPIANASFSNNPTNLQRTADEDTAFTAMTRTYTPNTGYEFENVGDINVTLPALNPDNIGVSKAMSGGNIVLTITGNVGQDDTTTTVSLSGNARAQPATGAIVQYSFSSSSGPWSSITSGSTAFTANSGSVVYIKVTPQLNGSTGGAYTLSTGSSYLSIDDNQNTSGNAQVHTFTYGTNDGANNVKVNCNVLGGTSTIFVISTNLAGTQ